MNILRDLDLQPHNTLAVPSRAEYFVLARSVPELVNCLAWSREKSLPTYVLGGGSNVVLRDRLPGVTLKMGIVGIEILASSDDYTLLRVGAGENWHGLVSWCLAQNLYGLENLALIPGTVGAAPVQNIGAYGVEVRHFIERVEGIEQATGKMFSLAARDCDFSYRDSVFKKDAGRGRIITHVIFRLPRHFRPNISYPALASELNGMEVSAANLFEAVCRIRISKLPNPTIIPNCGSFFKNPIITNAQFASLVANYPQIPNYPADLNLVKTHRKIAAGWLIDQAGWRGISRHGVSVHSAQALVLTNPDRRNASSVLALAEDIQSSVAQKFGVILEMEPQVLGE